MRRVHRHRTARQPDPQPLRALRAARAAQLGDGAAPVCACGSRMRPDVVWFGEALPAAALEVAFSAFGRAEVALVIGTSGVVEPAANLGRLALQGGAALVEINPAPTPLSPHATLFLPLDAADGLRALL